MNRQLSTGEYQARQQLFRGDRTCLDRTSRRARNWRFSKPSATRSRPKSSPRPISNPVGGNPEAGPQQSARGDAPAEGGRIRDPRPQAGGSCGEACRDRDIESTILAWSASSLFYKPSLERLGIDVSVRTVDDVQYREPSPQFRLRHDHRRLGPVAVAGQRAARVLGFASRRTSRVSRNIRRHQESRRRRPDRAHDLRQGSCRTGRGHQGDGPGAALEFLRRPAIHLSGFQRYARWDRFSHPEPLPKYGVSGFPTMWWYDAEKAAKIGKRS